MDALLPIVLAGAYFLTQKKGRGSGDNNAGGSTRETVEDAQETGRPVLMIDKSDINRALRRIRFEVGLPDGQVQEVLLKLRRGDSSDRVGGYWLTSQVEDWVDPKGNVKNDGAVNIALMTGNREAVISAKRIIVPLKQIINVK